MEEKWRSTPALRALAPAVLKQLQDYQEEADTLFKETQASTTQTLCCTSPVASACMHCTVQGGRTVQIDRFNLDSKASNPHMSWDPVESSSKMEQLALIKLLGLHVEDIPWESS